LRGFFPENVPEKVRLLSKGGFLADKFLPIEAECLNFINADLIAQGLSPFQPSKMAIEAGRLMIQYINNCVRKSESF